MRTAIAIEQVDWMPQPLAEDVVRKALNAVTTLLPEAAKLGQRLLGEAGVRLLDLIDTIHLDERSPLLAEALATGWKRDATAGAGRLYRNALGVFPQIAVGPAASPAFVGLDLKVESVAHFLFTHQLTLPVIGNLADRLRTAVIYEKRGSATVRVAERHGWRDFEGGSPIDPALRLDVYEMLLVRERSLDEDESFHAAEALIDSAIARVGRDVTCELFFAAEREFWMLRNRAGKLQFHRQQALGIGWANHDHHTYRSSRRHFKRLVALWEKLGLVCRERFYAGREAGWGAQVMEQPVTGIVTFNDVDLSPDELFGDFSHAGLAPRDHLGTIGLWCGLHGESFNGAGMHHLEAMFGFNELRDQLRENGVNIMKPFTDFPHLRQAFTEGERWEVAPQRIERLVRDRLITDAQAQQFSTSGALGSHLENLERNAGFKGFNQTGVSEIIAATDPRQHAVV